MDSGDGARASKALTDHIESYPDDEAAVLPASADSFSDFTEEATPSSSFLSDVHADGQVNGYYCGPATGLGMIKTMLGSGYHSRYDGSLPYQVNMASDSHMMTDYHGNTDWGRKQWIRGVNRWMGGSLYVQSQSPTAQTIGNVVRFNVWYKGYGVGVSTVENEGLAHYNGHPDRTIGHWVWSYGYSGDGSYIHSADPSHTLTTFPDAQPRFSIGRSSLKVFTDPHGIAH